METSKRPSTHLRELIDRVVSHECLPDKQHQVGAVQVDQVGQGAHQGLVVLSLRFFFWGGGGVERGRNCEKKPSHRASGSHTPQLPGKQEGKGRVKARIHTPYRAKRRPRHKERPLRHT